MSGGVWRCLAVSGGVWRGLAVSGGVWRGLAGSGGVWVGFLYLPFTEFSSERRRLLL